MGRPQPGAEEEDQALLDQLVDELSKLVDVQTVRSSRGAVQVLVSGNLLVTSNKAVEMQKVRDASGDPRISIGNTDGFVPVAGGRIGGLLELQDSVVPEVRSGFDELARQLPFIEERLGSRKWGGVLVGWLRAAEPAADRRLVEVLLERYYDPLYRRSESNYRYELTVETGDPERAARSAVEWIDAQVARAATG